MARTVRLCDSTVQLVGSVHSTTAALDEVMRIKPTHLFLESTRDLIGTVRAKGKYSGNLRDLPSLVQYSESNRIPLHGIDTSAADITARVIHGYSIVDRLRLWNYIASRKLLYPVASVAFNSAMHRSVSPFDRFVSRWCVAPSLLEDVRRLSSTGSNDDDVLDLIASRQNVESFLSSSDYDPQSYLDLCRKTGIDERLQSVLIDYRNDFMCHQIRRIIRTVPKESLCAVVVGKNHANGMFKNLSMGMKYVPETLEFLSPGKSSFMDQLLLAHLLNS